jgi:hypothetical protein
MKIYNPRVNLEVGSINSLFCLMGVPESHTFKQI